MSRGTASVGAPVVLICGEDEFAVKQRAREIYRKWSEELGGTDHEIVDAQVSHSGEALKALARLRESLQTLPFFGSGKAIWLQNCTFLGDERAASAQAVTETLGELAQELKEFRWDNVRLLVSAGKVDKRKTFYKTLEKIGSVETFAGWSINDKEWVVEAESWARTALRSLGKQVSEEALGQLVSHVGPNSRQLQSEVEKLALYVGPRSEVEVADVDAIITRNKQARAFALADALGERDLPRLLRCLDQELWEVKTDSKSSEIGLLYGLISKVRVMIFLKEMVREKWISPSSEFVQFKTQLQRVPVEALPSDKRFNPLAMNSYLLYKALPHARRYSISELTNAMALLLECNQRLVLSQLDETLVLQQTLIRIIRGDGEKLAQPRGNVLASRV